MSYSFPKGYRPWNKGMKGFLAGEEHYNFGKKRPGIGGAPKGHTAWNKGKTYKQPEGTGAKISAALKGHRNWYMGKYTKLEAKKARSFRERQRELRKTTNGVHNLEEWLELKVKYNFMCLCCKQFEPDIKLTEDHIVPLSMGGSNDITNIQPLCLTCNQKKHTKIISYLPLNSNELINGERGVI